MATLVGHKFGSLKCVCVLYIRPGRLVKRGKRYLGIYWSAGPLLLGGGKEVGQREGTKNAPYIVGLARVEELLT